MTERPPWEQYQAAEPPPWESYAAPPPEQFPTFGQTMATFGKSAVRAVPGMVMGALEGSAAPFMALPRDLYALAKGNPAASPTVQQMADSFAHMRAAMAPDDAGPGERIGEAVSAVPMVGPAIVGAVKGAGKILTPAYRAATGGSGTITPQEMRQAAETGGEGAAMLAVPELARGAAAIPYGRVAKVGAKVGLSQLAPGAAKILQAKAAIGDFVLGSLMKKATPYLQDVILGAIQKGDVAKAAAAVAKAEASIPASMAASAEAEAAVPASIKAPPAGTTRETNAERNLRLFKQFQQDFEGAKASVPEPGNVKMATVYTKPKTEGGPVDKPMTPKQRDLVLEQLKAAEEAGLDIFEAFPAREAPRKATLRETAEDPANSPPAEEQATAPSASEGQPYLDSDIEAALRAKVPMLKHPGLADPGMPIFDDQGRRVATRGGTSWKQLADMDYPELKDITPKRAAQAIERDADNPTYLRIKEAVRNDWEAQIEREGLRSAPAEADLSFDVAALESVAPPAAATTGSAASAGAARMAQANLLQFAREVSRSSPKVGAKIWVLLDEQGLPVRALTPTQAAAAARAGQKTTWVQNLW